MALKSPFESENVNDNDDNDNGDNGEELELECAMCCKSIT